MALNDASRAEVGARDVCTAPCREKVQGIIAGQLAHHKLRASTIQVLFDLLENMTPAQEKLLSELPWWKLLEDRR